MSNTLKVSWPVGKGKVETREWSGREGPLLSRESLEISESDLLETLPKESWCTVSDGKEEKTVFLKGRIEAHFQTTETFTSIVERIDSFEEFDNSPYLVRHNAVRIMCFLFTQYMPELARPGIFPTPQGNVSIEFQGLDNRFLRLTVERDKSQLAGGFLTGEGNIFVEYRWEDPFIDDRVAVRISQAIVGFIEASPVSDPWCTRLGGLM